MTKELTGICILEGTLVTQFDNFAHIMQQSTSDQQITVDVPVAMRDIIGQGSNSQRMLEQPAKVDMMHCLGCRNPGDKRP